MKVRELMTGETRACAAWADVGFAAHLMWNGDCGSLPVVDENDQLVGMVTDRDICIALSTRNVRASDLPVSQVMHREVHTIHPEDDLTEALGVMRDYHVHRLPVVDDEEAIVGMLSMTDIVREAKIKSTKGPTYGDVVDTLKVIRGREVPLEVKE
jgi:CBS domain-containing protein